MIMRACLVQKIWNRQDTGPCINYVSVMIISKQHKFTKYQVMSFSMKRFFSCPLHCCLHLSFLDDSSFCKGHSLLDKYNRHVITESNVSSYRNFVTLAPAFVHIWTVKKGLKRVWRFGESVCMCVHVSYALTRAFIHVDTWERYSWGRVFAILTLILHKLPELF